MYELAESLSTLLVIVKLQKSKFGGSNGRAYEFIDVAFIFGIEKQLAIFSDMLLELFFELDDMLENKFFLGCVFTVGNRRRFLLFEFSTAFEFLVYDVLSSLEELQQLIVHFRLHF